MAGGPSGNKVPELGCETGRAGGSGQWLPQRLYFLGACSLPAPEQAVRLCRPAGRGVGWCVGSGLEVRQQMEARKLACRRVTDRCVSAPDSLQTSRAWPPGIGS